jgi:hypothetical protein
MVVWLTGRDTLIFLYKTCDYVDHMVLWREGYTYELASNVCPHLSFISQNVCHPEKKHQGTSWKPIIVQRKPKWLLPRRSILSMGRLVVMIWSGPLIFNSVKFSFYCIPYLKKLLTPMNKSLPMERSGFTQNEACMEVEHWWIHDHEKISFRALNAWVHVYTMVWYRRRQVRSTDLLQIIQLNIIKHELIVHMQVARTYDWIVTWRNDQRAAPAHQERSKLRIFHLTPVICQVANYWSAHKKNVRP